MPGEARENDEQAVAPPAPVATPAPVAAPTVHGGTAGLAAGVGNAAFSGMVSSAGGGLPRTGAVSSSLVRAAAMARNPKAAAGAPPPEPPRPPSPKPSLPGLAQAVRARENPPAGG